MPQIKHYFWLIILVVFTAILSADTSFEYALGVISANVLRDGVILTLLVFTFSYFYKKKSWFWFDWLNVIAYTTIIASFLKPIIQEFRYQGVYIPDLARIIIFGVIVALVCYTLWIKKRNKIGSTINLKQSLGFIKNEQGFTSIGKGLVALLLLVVLAFPAYKIYDKIQVTNLITASDKGEAYSQNILGVRYAKGDGVVKSEFKALDLFKKSAEQGFSRAQYNLGRAYYRGEGTPKNYTLAFHWLNKAIEQENENAQYWYAVLYYSGIVFEKDLEKGKYYLNRAIVNGSKEAKKFKKENGIQ